MIICITGMPGSGKSVAANYLARKGFEVIEMGDIIRDKMKKEGIKITNESIREYALSLRKRFGNDIVAKLTVQKINGKRKNMVIVGVRSKKEIDYFRKRLGNFYVIALTAPKMVRYKRLKERGRQDDVVTMKEFKYREEKERKYGVESAIKNADFVIANTSSINDLKKDIDSALALLKRSRKQS
ncbi:MAG: AAA family ATPase [Candidatus Micrarchaeales archaeon]